MKPRKQPSDLPPRVYEKYGKRIYSIGYKRPNGVWTFRLRCDVNDRAEIAALKQEATYRATGEERFSLYSNTFSAIAKGW